MTNRDINQRENCKILYACEEAQKSENVMENGKNSVLLTLFSFSPHSPHIGFTVNTRLQLGGGGYFQDT